MIPVDILFCNLQSHVNTRFTIHPGMNFILAKGNNVGKSTIFRVLSAVACAPNNSTSKLNSLIRTGCSLAYAAFKFNGESVIARFTRTPGEASKLFFEHVHSDGVCTRSEICPTPLLAALGIVLGDDGNPINFNDADSVQLISEVSTAADSIITRVILDEKVEHLKSNLYALAKEINLDSRMLNSEVQRAQEIVDSMEYNNSAVEFEKVSSKLEVMARVADVLPKVERFTVFSQDRFTLIGKLLNLIQAVDSLPAAKVQTPSIELRAGLHVLEQLAYVGYAPPVVRNISEVQRAKFNSALKVLASLRVASASTTDCVLADKLLQTALLDKQRALVLLHKELDIVDCPVKGKVLYSGEKCIPYTD